MIIEHGREYWHKVNATQKAILERMKASKVLEVHSDGDLTFEAEGRTYVLTTSGELFVKAPRRDWNGPGAMPQTDRDKISLTELKARLNQYEKLTDMTERLLFPPPPKMPIKCTQCGRIYDYFQPTWDEVRFELNKGRDPQRELPGLCPHCAGPEEEDNAPSAMPDVRMSDAETDLLRYYTVPPEAE